MPLKVADLKGQVAIVTGASRGIGEGIARSLAKRGAKVVVVGRTEQGGGPLPGTIHDTAREIEAMGGKAIAVRCDVTKDEQVSAMVQQALDAFGRIDLLVSNAGVNFVGPFADLPMKRWDLVMNVNLRGTVLCCKEVIPHMQRQGKGNIVTISSMWGRHWIRHQAPYCVSKVAVERFSQILADELKPVIAVNCIAPAGGVDTEGLAKVYAGADRSRWVSVEAFAEAVAFLAAVGSPDFTGRVLNDFELYGFYEYAKVTPIGGGGSP